MFVDVALGLGTFVYKLPKSLESKVGIGSLVKVPLRKAELEGWIVGTVHGLPLHIREIKEVIGVCWPESLLTPSLIELGKWMASYYQSSLGTVLHLMVPEIRKTKRIIELPSYKATKLSDYMSIRPSVKRGLPSVISDPIKKMRFKSVLVYGPRRMGIYLRAIERALSYGRGVIFLVPEIAYTPDVFSLLQKRFDGLVALLHSGLKKDERWSEWLDIKEGIERIVVGAMSAVFAPVHNLGLIIVDEEQDTSYKSERHPFYSTVVVGTMRAKIEDCVYISGSRTPSIEAFYNAESKKSDLVRLIPPKRTGKVWVVDMRRETDPVFSALLKEKLRSYIAKGEKIILFLNRKGFSSFILCEDCGYIPKCPNCDISLTYYMAGLALKCHYCGYRERAPGYCPQCKGVSLSHKGVGTARVESSFNKLFPGVKIFRLDLDTVSTKYVRHVFKSFANGEIQVLLGSQLVAKRLEFPEVGLVGVISTDTGLNLPDFRCPEHTFSLLMELTTRGKEAILQTYNPGHRVLKYLLTHDYYGFYGSEKLVREEYDYPPYSHLVRLLIEGRSELPTQKKIDKLTARLKKEGLEFLGPSACPVARKKGKFRYHVLLKVKDPRNLLLAQIVHPGTVIDVDPVQLI